MSWLEYFRPLSDPYWSEQILLVLLGPYSCIPNNGTCTVINFEDNVYGLIWVYIIIKIVSIMHPICLIQVYMYIRNINEYVNFRNQSTHFPQSKIVNIKQHMAYQYANMKLFLKCWNMFFGNTLVNFERLFKLTEM